LRFKDFDIEKLNPDNNAKREVFRRDVIDALTFFSGKKLNPTQHRILWGIVSNKVWRVDRYNSRKTFLASVKGSGENIMSAEELQRFKLGLQLVSG